VSDLPASLVFVDDEMPGIRRRRAGRGFAYAHAGGRRVTSARHLARIKSLAIPPAWTEVWICPDPAGHLQATGRDARGRKQYRYHDDYRLHREEQKFDRLPAFGRALVPIRRRVAADLRHSRLDREKVLALVVHLLESTLIRVGNEEYSRENGSFGVTTLRSPQVHVRGPAVRFAFAGKSGVRHTVELHDARTARAIRRLQDLPGQRLLRWVDTDGALHDVGSADVNAYLRAAGGEDYSAKDFRTWMGTLMAAAGLAAVETPSSDRDARSMLRGAMTIVGRRLGNTPTVARNSYVHPTVVDAFLDGSLHDRWRRLRRRDQRWLTGEERTLLALLDA
jgi:DNA topoisomerase-1